MADDLDWASQQSEEHIARSIQNTLRSGPPNIPGPAICSQCGYKNDRRREGFAICWSCHEENQQDAAS